MKYLFAGIGIVLLIASAVTALMMPEQQTGRPIIYWVTDANPARIEQIKLFEQWMVQNGHVTPDGRSAVELRLDTANNDATKKINQSGSGVAGDVMDMNAGGEVRYFQSMGVLADLTDSAKEMGFDSSHTYDAAHDEIVVDHRQFAFPCNVNAHGYWLNNEVFGKAGVVPPTWRWTFDDFERIGKDLCARANAGRNRREVFLTDQFDSAAGTRSLGVDRFNETMTRCTLDDRRYVALLERVYKWTFVDHIMPQPEDMEAFSAQQAGYLGNSFQLFNRGNLALIYSARYALIEFRQFNESRRSHGQEPAALSVVEPPNGGFPNASVMSRAAAVFRGSPNPKYAKLFMAFLVSREYNMQIVEDADSLPPDPAYTKIPAFTHPPKHPEEWGVHEPWAKLAETIAIPVSYSPFILDRVATRIQNDQITAYMAGRSSAGDAARRTVQEIDAEIDLRLKEDPALSRLYRQRLIDQQRIDELRAKGQRVPPELISNPFHRMYYAHMGWLAKE